MDNTEKLSIKAQKFYKEHNGYMENGRVYLSILCDSTWFFLCEMVEFLEMIGCTDIQTEGYLENDGLYGYRYKANGKIPGGDT